MKDFLELDNKLQQLGIDIFIATQNIDTTTPTGKMQRTILLAFAEFERDMIADRTREKLFSQAQKGQWGGGHVLLGYDVKDKKMVVNEKEAALVKRIFEYYLEEPSTHKVSQKLNREGYVTKIRVTRSGKKTGGNKFNKDGVRDILRNRIYNGIITFNNEVFKGIHDAIVSDELFKKIQDRLDLSTIDNKATANTESPLTLLGLTKCGHCGSLLSTSSTLKKETQKRYYFYKCSKAAHHTKEHCGARDLPAEELEDTILKIMEQVVNNEEFLNAIVAQMRGNSGTNKLVIEKDLHQLKINLSKVTQQLDNLIHHMIEHTELNNSNMLVKKVKDLEDQKSSINNSIQQKERELDQIYDKEIDSLVLRKILSEFTSKYYTFNKEEKHRLNHLIFAAITSYFKR